MYNEERIIGEPPVMWWLGSHFTDTPRNRKRVDRLFDCFGDCVDEYSDEAFELQKVWMKPVADGYWQECKPNEPNAIKATKAVYFD